MKRIHATVKGIIQWGNSSGVGGSVGFGRRGFLTVVGSNVVFPYNVSKDTGWSVVVDWSALNKIVAWSVSAVATSSGKKVKLIYIL